MAETNDDVKLITATVDEWTYIRMEYFAKQRGLKVTELLARAIQFYIDEYEGRPYQPRVIEVERLNMIQEVLYGLVDEKDQLVETVMLGFYDLLSYTNGNNGLTNKLQADDLDIDAIYGK